MVQKSPIFTRLCIWNRLKLVFAIFHEITQKDWLVFVFAFKKYSSKKGNLRTSWNSSVSDKKTENVGHSTIRFNWINLIDRNLINIYQDWRLNLELLQYMVQILKLFWHKQMIRLTMKKPNKLWDSSHIDPSFWIIFNF